jgi:hypothetical protein
MNGDGRNCADINECAANNGGCQQNCINTLGSYYCNCSSGYTLNTDGKSCNDSNECATHNGGCQQNCTNTVGSYYCSCSTGYTLNNDSRNCISMNAPYIRTDVLRTVTIQSGVTCAPVSLATGSAMIAQHASTLMNALQTTEVVNRIVLTQMEVTTAAARLDSRSATMG